MFCSITSDLGLTLFGGDGSNAYANSPEPNTTYLTIDDAYAGQYKENNRGKENCGHVVPVYHC